MNKCECSKYTAAVAADIEDNIESGDWEEFTTGCDKQTPRTFAPGHDAKLKSFLIRYSGGEYEITRADGGMSSTADAETHAAKYEFGHMVIAGIARKAEKEQAKADKKAAKAERKATKTKPLAEVVAEEEAKHAEAERNSRPEPEWDDEPGTVDLTGLPEVIAKVGRWEYRGIVKNDTFYFMAKDGHTRKETTKFTVVREV